MVITHQAKGRCTFFFPLAWLIKRTASSFSTIVNLCLSKISRC